MSAGSPQSTSAAALERTALYDRHVALGAKMVPFAGYEMPVQYNLGVLKEHLWTRDSAGLFDVSHMGLAYLRAEDGSHETVARALETLVPADILNLAPGRQRYSQLTTDDGGIIDDLMVSRSAEPGSEGSLFLVVNAGRKAVDYAHILSRLPDGVHLSPTEARRRGVERSRPGRRGDEIHGCDAAGYTRQHRACLAVRIHRRGRLRTCRAGIMRRGGVECARRR
jgi:glycine cleavage system aminomethyltransferase T